MKIIKAPKLRPNYPIFLKAITESYLGEYVRAGSLEMKDFPVKGVVVGVTRDGAGASLNILAGVLEGRWTTHLRKGAGLLLAPEEASTDTGASLLTGGICPERVSNLHR